MSAGSSKSDDGSLPFVLGNASSTRMMPYGGPDPNDGWGRRYRRVRDEMMEQHRADGHDPQVWRARVSGGEGGSVTVALVRCGRCDYRTRIHRFPRSWASYKGSSCVPVPLDVFERRIQHATKREHRLILWILSGLAAAMGVSFWIAGMAPNTANRWLAFLVAVGLITGSVILGLLAIRARS